MHAWPETIQRLLCGRDHTLDDMGKSGSTVCLFEDCVLKVEPHTDAIEAMITMMRWLEGKLPVPKVICHVVEEGMSFLVMRRMAGQMLCDPEQMADLRQVDRLAAEALRMLWQVDITDCPVVHTAASDLALAQERVLAGEVSRDAVAKLGFDSAEAALKWAEQHCPVEEPVLSHGDLCLPNMLVQDGKVCGFIDLGSCAVCDRWSDIADLTGSLRRNCDGTFGPVYAGFDPDGLFRELGIEPDAERLRFYEVLDVLMHD